LQNHELKNYELQNIADLIGAMRKASRKAARSHIPNFIFEIHFDVGGRYTLAPLQARLCAALVIGYTQLRITNWAHSENEP
jgi:hypothetical protein